VFAHRQRAAPTAPPECPVRDDDSLSFSSDEMDIKTVDDLQSLEKCADYIQFDLSEASKDDVGNALSSPSGAGGIGKL
jgi:hypothetical protein